MASGVIRLGPIEGREDNIFGSGINFFNGERAGRTCVTGWKLRDSPEANDKDRLHTLVVQDSSSYASMLNSATNVSASGWGQSASGAFSYLRDQTGSDTSISFVCLRVSESQTRYANMDDAKIKPAALQLLEEKGPIAFARKYGTHCVYGVAYGGSFAGRLKIENKTATDKAEIAASLKASISAFGANGTVDTTLSEKISSASAHSSVNMNAVATGSPRIEYKTNDLAQMLASCNAFKLNADATRTVDGSPIAFIAMTWDEFEDIADTLDKIGQPDGLKFSDELARAETLNGELRALAYLEGTCDSLLDAQRYAIPAYEKTLRGIKKTIQAARKRINDLNIETLHALNDQTLEDYLAAQRLRPLLDAIARGQVLIKVSYWLDGAFASQAGTILVPATLHGGDVRVKTIAHGQSRDGKDPQSMTLWFSVWESAGDLFVQTKLVFTDPYAPKDRLNLAYGGPYGRSSGGGFPTEASTAVWADYPDNKMRAEFAGAEMFALG